MLETPIMNLPTQPSIPRPQSLGALLSDLIDSSNNKRFAMGSLLALDWDDEHLVLGWMPEPIDRRETEDSHIRPMEIRTHTIPDGLMVEGQWQDAARWMACLERWVAATQLDQPQLVLALPAKDLSHHWVDASSHLDIDRTDVLMGLVDQAASQQALDGHGQVSLDDQVFDVLSEADVWPGATMPLCENERQEHNLRWCLVGAAEAKVAALETLFAGSHFSLTCLDSRPRALLAAWHPHLSGEGHACLLDDHLSTTQWMVTGRQGLLEMGQLSHQRLSIAERVDHLIGRLGSAQASHSFDTIWLTHPKGSELSEVATRVADALNLSVVFMPSLNDHPPSASLQLAVQGLLIGQGARVVTHAF